MARERRPQRRPPPPRRPRQRQSSSTRSSPTTKQTEPDRAPGPGQERWSSRRWPAPSPSTRTSRARSNAAIAAIDEKLSEQLNAIMHHPEFQKLEGTLARPALPGHEQRDRHDAQDQGAERLASASCSRTWSKAVEFDQSQMFKKIYENEFGTPGGEPYGALIGDYELTNHPEDIELLRMISNVAAARVRAVHRGGRRRAVRLRQLDRAVQAARPGQDLRDASSTPSGAASATPRTRASSAWSCRACSPGCPTARRPSRSTSSTTRKRDDDAARPSRCSTTTTPG